MYRDEESENSNGVYSELRAIASEAELERRVNAKKAMISAKHSTYIAIIALVMSFVSLVASFL
jgi:hypothetical protein